MTPRPTRHSRRGAVLMEVLLALVLFVAAALAALGVLDRSMDSLTAVRQRDAGWDIARSAISRLEAGMATPETLAGPVRPEGSDAFDADAAQWEIEIDTQPSEFAELSRVTVRAVRRRAGGEPVVDAELHQLVRLLRSVEEPADIDPLSLLSPDPEPPSGGGS